jgi:hypothetical protein
MTLPYPPDPPGIRLIRRDQIPSFDSTIRELAGQLDSAVRQLDEHYEILQAGARERLGSLLEALRQLDLTMAVKFGMAAATVLQQSPESLLLLEDGIKLYNESVQLPAALGGRRRRRTSDIAPSSTSSRLSPSNGMSVTGRKSPSGSWRRTGAGWTRRIMPRRRSTSKSIPSSRQ